MEKYGTNRCSKYVAEQSNILYTITNIMYKGYDFNKQILC